MTSVCWPLPMASQAPTWAAVGSANDASNQPRVAGEKRSGAGTAPLSPRSPTRTPGADPAPGRSAQRAPELPAAGDAQLAVRAGQVGLDGLDRHVQGARDLVVHDARGSE